MKFKSKIDWWFHLTVFFIVALGCAMPIALGMMLNSLSSLFTGIIISAFTLGFVFPMYLNTYYTLEDEALLIRCGFCVNKRIPYKEVTSIFETRDPSASVGLSLDRISINYNILGRKYFSKGEVLISPKNKQEFIRLLQQRIV